MKGTYYINCACTVIILGMCAGCSKPCGEEQRSGAHHDVSTNAMGTVSSTRAKPVSAATNISSVNITADTLRSNILYPTEQGRYIIADFDRYVAPELFATNRAYTPQSLYLLCCERMKDVSNRKRAHAYCNTLLSLRYRTLLPLLKEQILSAVTTNDLGRANIAVSRLDYIAHPDTLRTFLEMDAALPSNSVLCMDRHADPSFPNDSQSREVPCRCSHGPTVCRFILILSTNRRHTGLAAGMTPLRSSETSPMPRRSPACAMR